MVATILMIFLIVKN